MSENIISSSFRDKISVRSWIYYIASLGLLLGVFIYFIYGPTAGVFNFYEPRKIKHRLLYFYAMNKVNKNYIEPEKYELQISKRNKYKIARTGEVRELRLDGSQDDLVYFLLFPIGNDNEYTGLAKTRINKIETYLLLNLLIWVIITFAVYSFFWFKFIKYRVLPSYLPCPVKICLKSIKVWTKWKCDYCHERQNKEHYITDKCDKCRRELETIICEYCGTEIKL